MKNYARVFGSGVILGILTLMVLQYFIDKTIPVNSCYLNRDELTIAKVTSQNRDLIIYSYVDRSEDLVLGVSISNFIGHNSRVYSDFKEMYPKQIGCESYEIGSEIVRLKDRLNTKIENLSLEIDTLKDKLHIRHD